MATTAQGREYRSNHDNFLLATQHMRYNVPARTAVAENSRCYFDLPQSNLALRLIVTVTGSITISGTVTSGTWAGQPADGWWSIIQKWQLSNNSSVLLHNLQGGSLNTWLRYRHGIDYNQADTSFSNSSDKIAQMGWNNPIVSGANIAAGTYSLNKTFVVPIAYDHKGSVGLINLQNKGNQYTVEIDTGTITQGLGTTGGTTSLINSLVGSGLTYSNTLSITMAVETFTIPALPDVRPSVSKFMMVSDQGQTLIAGQNTFNIPDSELFTLIINKLSNAGSYVTDANVSQLQLKFGGNRTRYQDTPQALNGADFSDINFAVPPQNGCHVWDLMHRKSEEQQPDIFDSFNDINATNFQSVVTTASGLSLSGISEFRLITESLRTAA